MITRDNRYLKDRASRRMQDGRNPYGSRGGYVTTSRPGRDRNMEDMARRNDYNRGNYDYNSDYDYAREDYARNDYAKNDYSRRDMHNEPYPTRFSVFGTGGMMPRYDYASEEMGKEYEEDLKKWIEKMKKKDRFNVSKEQILQQAKNMGIRFDKYDEMEFYAAYLAMVTDYKSLSNDYTLYLKLAKEFLEDDDIAVSPSEKICIYMYKIVMGEE